MRPIVIPQSPSESYTGLVTVLSRPNCSEAPQADRGTVATRATEGGMA